MSEINTNHIHEQKSDFSGSNVIQLNHFRGTEEIQYGIIELQQSFKSDLGIEKEVKMMEVQTKEYIDQRINSLEKMLDQKFEYQQNIISEKLDHLSTRTEKHTNDNFYKLKEELEKNKKEDRRYLIGTAIALAAVIVTLLGYVF